MTVRILPDKSLCLGIRLVRFFITLRLLNLQFLIIYEWSIWNGVFFVNLHPDCHPYQKVIAEI